MTAIQLRQALNYVNHSREKRMEMASLVRDNPNLIKPLLEVAFDVDNPISMKACWVMEFTSKENLPFIFPHLDFFTENIDRVHLDSSVRPIAKICEYLILSYYDKVPNQTKNSLTEKHLEKITSACFDWLIGKHKVAAKAYSMTCLLLLGKKYDWIHSELKLVLEQDYSKESAAYQARARRTLARLKK